MRLFPILAAIVVSAIVYGFVFQREAVLAMLAPAPENADETAEVEPKTPPAESPNRVGVIAVHSTAQSVNNAIVLRGQTEAFRQVDLRARSSS